MKFVCESGYLPNKAHEDDGGIDLYSAEDKVVKARDCAVFDTQTRFQIPRGYAGLLVSKSGLNMKGLTSTGLIDCGYTGTVRVKLYNNSDKDYHVKAGDKISQLMVVPILNEKLEQVDTLEDTERGENGFGSSGR